MRLYASDIGKRRQTGAYQARRARIHIACRQTGDETLGHSAPSNDVRCARCGELLGETAIVVQRFPRDGATA